MPRSSFFRVEDQDSGFATPRVSVSDRAGERLHSYARVQEGRRQLDCQAQHASDAARHFHPHISGLARSPSLKRAPLYTAARRAPTPPPADSATSPVRRSPSQWHSFFLRNAAYEQRRNERLRALKSLVAEETLRECVFRPKVSALPVVAAADRAEAPSRPAVGRGDSEVLTQQWMQSVEAFNREMELLKEELASLKR
ncbi:hypothetical protein ABL78_1567 [Leptomonas seymouri]|uniref:Uncharacterized protein n=1 Tax=Leptomonas seymouri TaxID=5684 RepID=A0A0N1I0H3_LEPSE|nr:hypothetical protein ABL78_1567 [Leptomonas seymouri]|eukprot:KPI89338.1 hypothetical protein ABL78_1567 [Leptomonas seymouri]